MISQRCTTNIRLTSGFDVKIAGNFWFPLTLAVVTVSAVGAVALPVLIPLILGSSTGLGYAEYSHITRSSAFVAFTLLWVSMLAGLSITSKTARKWPGMSWSFGLHRYTTLLGLGFAVMHALVLLSDQVMGLTPLQLLVPFMATPFKPQWLGLGQVALYALTAVALSFYARNRLGIRMWRLVHSLSFALFLMALIHGLRSGSDSGTWWATGLYWVSAASVLVGSVLRIMAARVGHSREKAVSTGLVAVGGRAQTRPLSTVLQPESKMNHNALHGNGVRVLVTE